MILRDYQDKAILELRRSLSTGHRTPMLKMSTGSGKTVVAGKIIEGANSKDKRVAFIVPKLALVDQASAHLDAVGIDHGVIQADHWKTDYSKKIQVISAQTLIRRKPWNFDLGIIDEAHNKFKGILDLMSTWDRIPFIGLSATPFTKGLGNHYDDLIDPISIQELINQDYLVDADAYGPSKPDMTGVAMSAGDYNQKQAAERVNTDPLIADIISTWKKLANGKQTICFATNVAHSQHIVQRFIDAGVKAVHIDAYTDSVDRRRAIQDFKDERVQVLCSVGVLHTGFDAPNAEVAILARPTKSLSLHIQMIGRVLRIHPGKERAMILDHAGNIERLGFHTDPTPDYLDDGTVTETEEEKQEREEKLPVTCPNCYTLKPVGVVACPTCGFEYVRKSKIKEGAGELKKLKKNNREYTNEQKKEFFGGLKQYALEHGYKEAWCSHKYKEKFGVWPNAHKDARHCEPTEEVKSFIKHGQIKYAKRRQA